MYDVKEIQLLCFAGLTVLFTNFMWYAMRNKEPDWSMSEFYASVSRWYAVAGWTVFDFVLIMAYYVNL